jgi:hypothetical protein
MTALAGGLRYNVRRLILDTLVLYPVHSFFQDYARPGRTLTL